jgi:glucokinase
VQVEIDNDLKVSALAEMDLAGSDKSIVLLYMGTGFGSAFVEKGMIIRGESNLAGEIGHIPFKKAPFLCGCGKDNCVELFASGIGLQKWIEYYGICVDEPTLEALEKVQNVKAEEILENFYEALLHATSTIVTLLNPNSLILGGAVFKNNPTLVNFLKENLNLQAFKPSLKELEIRLSTFSSANLKGVDILRIKKENIL